VQVSLGIKTLFGFITIMIPLGGAAPLPAALPWSLPWNDEVYQIGSGS
jgi:hypothetical protein